MHFLKYFPDVIRSFQSFLQYSINTSEITQNEPIKDGYAILIMSITQYRYLIITLGRKWCGSIILICLNCPLKYQYNWKLSKHSQWIFPSEMAVVHFFYNPGNHFAAKKNYCQGLCLANHNTCKLLLYQLPVKQKRYFKGFV